MPNINVRFTQEQHAELVEWAKNGHRSLQKEIIWRLFMIEGGQAPKYAPAAGGKHVGMEGKLDGEAHEVKTDFK